MQHRKTALAAGLAAMIMAFAPAAAVATPIDIFIESDGNRGLAAPDGGDIVGSVIPTVVSASQRVGIAGRVQNLEDNWEFTSTTAFNVSFVDLILSPDDLNAFLDGSDTSPPTAPNSDLREVNVSLLDSMMSTLSSKSFFPSDVNSETLIFGNVAAGTYTLNIDGLVPTDADPSEGATYDIEIAAVAPIPLPAAGWMLLAGLGGLVALRRRQAA